MIGAIWETLFYQPILNSLLVLYGLLWDNLGLAIIVFTIFIRAILFPFMKSQYDSSRKLREIQPELKKIQKKYSRNPKKAQEEQMKLYKKVGYNPLGCFFSMIVPLPFLIAIYQAIRALSSGEAIADIYPFVLDFLGVNGDFTINTMFLGIDLSLAYLPLARESSYIALEVLPYLLIVVLVGVSQYFSVKFNQGMMGTGAEDDKKVDKEKDGKNKKKKEDKKEPGDITSMMGDMNKSMVYTFPLMTSFIALSLPVAVSLYWILQSWVPVLMYRGYNLFTDRLRQRGGSEDETLSKSKKKRKK